MKKISFLLFLFVLKIDYAMALSCHMEITSTDEYLVTIKNVDKYNMTKNKNRISSSAQVEVLRIYKGNIDEISKVNKIDINMSCHDIWGIPCNELDDTFANTFKEGNSFIIYGPNIDIHKCGETGKLIQNSERLNFFEKDNPPIWIK